jgi:neutral ceramidase
VPSEGIHTRVQARALVLEQDGRKYALVQADLGGIPYALTQEVAKRIAATGITSERILLSATHTHSSTGPIWPADNLGYAALGGDAFDPRAFEVTARGIAEAILRADGQRMPARLGTATAELTGASRNRAFTAFVRNADVPADEAGRARRRPTPSSRSCASTTARGRPIAVWSNFAIHATSFGDGNLLFSGDNPGITEQLVEEELAREAKGRDVVNVWTNGNEGDISPNGDADRLGDEAVQHARTDFAKAHMAGRRVAAGRAARVARGGERMSTGPGGRGAALVPGLRRHARPAASRSARRRCSAAASCRTGCARRSTGLAGPGRAASSRA